MKKEDKELLFKDLCARLPYGVIVELDEKFRFNKGTRVLVKELLDLYCVEGIKPYLRPMSSMTDEEIGQYKCMNDALDENYEVHIDNAYPAFDWLNKNMFDYRGLIEKNLALDCTGLHIYD